MYKIEVRLVEGLPLATIARHLVCCDFKAYRFGLSAKMYPVKVPARPGLEQQDSV